MGRRPLEKNKQVLEFISIIEEVEKNKLTYSNQRDMFIQFIEYVDTPWDEYKIIKNKEQILEDYTIFNFKVYLPF